MPTNTELLLESIKDHNCGNPECPVEIMRKALEKQVEDEKKNGTGKPANEKTIKQSADMKKFADAMGKMKRRETMTLAELYALTKGTAQAIDKPGQVELLTADPSFQIGTMTGALIVLEAIGVSKLDNPIAFPDKLDDDGADPNAVLYGMIEAAGRTAAASALANAVGGSLVAVISGALGEALEKAVSTAESKKATKH